MYVLVLQLLDTALEYLESNQLMPKINKFTFFAKKCPKRFGSVFLHPTNITEQKLRYLINLVVGCTLEVRMLFVPQKIKKDSYY